LANPGAGDRNWTFIDTGMPGATSDLRPPIRRAGAIWRGVETFNTDERWSEAFRKMQLTNCGAAAISRCVITRGGIRETAH
jgi:hypothetical protein